MVKNNNAPFFTSKRVSYVFCCKVFRCLGRRERWLSYGIQHSVLINGWGPHVSRKDHTSHKISFSGVFLRFYKITSVGKG